MGPVDKVAYEALNNYCIKLEEHLQSDVFLFYGGIHPNHRTFFTTEFEKLARKKKHKSLAVNLTTNGGSVEMAEIIPEIIKGRFFQSIGKQNHAFWNVFEDRALQIFLFLLL